MVYRSRSYSQWVVGCLETRWAGVGLMNITSSIEFERWLSLRIRRMRRRPRMEWIRMMKLSHSTKHQLNWNFQSIVRFQDGFWGKSAAQPHQSIVTVCWLKYDYDFLRFFVLWAQEDSIELLWNQNHNQILRRTYTNDFWKLFADDWGGGRETEEEEIPFN